MQRSHSSQFLHLQHVNAFVSQNEYSGTLQLVYLKDIPWIPYSRMRYILDIADLPLFRTITLAPFLSLTFTRYAVRGASMQQAFTSSSLAISNSITPGTRPRHPS